MQQHCNYQPAPQQLAQIFRLNLQLLIIVFCLFVVFFFFSNYCTPLSYPVYYTATTRVLFIEQLGCPTICLLSKKGSLIDFLLENTYKPIKSEMICVDTTVIINFHGQNNELRNVGKLSCYSFGSI